MTNPTVPLFFFKSFCLLKTFCMESYGSGYFCCTNTSSPFPAGLHPVFMGEHLILTQHQIYEVMLFLYFLVQPTLKLDQRIRVWKTRDMTSHDKREPSHDHSDWFSQKTNKQLPGSLDPPNVVFTSAFLTTDIIQVKRSPVDMKCILSSCKCA